MAFSYIKNTSAKAKKMTGSSYKSKGSSPSGEGGKFAALKKILMKKKGVKNAGAVAASIGRKKFGNRKFAELSAMGRMAKK